MYARIAYAIGKALTCSFLRVYNQPSPAVCTKKNVSSYAIAKVAHTSLRARFSAHKKNARTQVSMNDGNFGCKTRSHRSYLLTACTTAFAGRAEMRSSEAGGTVEQAAPAGLNLKQAGANTNIHAAAMSIVAQHTGDTIFATTSGHVSDYV